MSVMFDFMIWYSSKLLKCEFSHVLLRVWRIYAWRCVRHASDFVFLQPIALTTYVMVTEMFPASSRSFPSVGINCSWGIGLVFLAVLGYFIRDWRTLQLVISVPNFLTVIYAWYVFASHCFLLNNSISASHDFCVYFSLKIKSLMHVMCLDSKYFFVLMVYDLIIDKGLGLISGFYQNPFHGL